jgi:SAM-dependent methyltransferase
MVESHKIIDKIEEYLQGSVMDIGCGDDTVILGAFGVDGRVSPCVSHVTDNLYDLPSQLPNLVETFDCVFSSHTLEHLPDAYRCVSEWSQFVKPGGYFILYLPEGGAYDNYSNPEHFHDTTYTQFTFWFRRAFCGEALTFTGLLYAAPKFILSESGLDVGENSYSFYLVAKKL